jgi:hypothetical protein
MTGSSNILSAKRMNSKWNDFTPDAIMELAESKYYSYTLLKNKMWKQPTAADKKCVGALMAQLQQLGDKVKKQAP